jgi:hypothetical protein
MVRKAVRNAAPDYHLIDPNGRRRACRVSSDRARGLIQPLAYDHTGL